MHNHPSAGCGLSPQDMHAAIQNNMQSMTAISPTGEYMTMLRPPGGWKKIDSTTIKTAFGESMDEIREAGVLNDYKDLIRAGRITPAKADEIVNKIRSTTTLDKLGIKYINKKMK